MKKGKQETHRPGYQQEPTRNLDINKNEPIRTNQLTISDHSLFVLFQSWLIGWTTDCNLFLSLKNLKTFLLLFFFFYHPKMKMFPGSYRKNTTIQYWSLIWHTTRSPMWQSKKNIKAQLFPNWILQVLKLLLPSLPHGSSRSLSNSGVFHVIWYYLWHVINQKKMEGFGGGGTALDYTMVTTDVLKELIFNKQPRSIKTYIVMAPGWDSVAKNFWSSTEI